MERLRRMCYGNQTASFFQEHKSLIRAYNVHMNDIILRLIPVLSAFYLANSYLLEEVGNPYIQYTCWGAIFIFTFLSFIRNYFPRPFLRHALLDSILCGEILFLFLTLVGPVSDPTNMSVYHPVLFFMLFILYIMPLHRILVYVIIHFLFYVIIDIYCKGFAIGITDIVNVSICATAGFFLGSNVLRSRLAEISSYDNLKIQSEEKIASATALANKDSLTHVNNRRAYHDLEEELNAVIRMEEELAFAIVICDVNGLKYVNDTYGHEKGDHLIRQCASDICSVYVHSPVYRYGGDEFVVLLRGQDYENRELLFKKICGYTAFASGMAIYIKDGDKSVSEVFQRADLRMYAHKSEHRR